MKGKFCITFIRVTKMATNLALWVFVFTNLAVAETFKLEENTAPLKNPYKGFYTEAETKLVNPTIPQTLAYSSFTWKDLEISENNFDWERIEKAWDWHTSKGRKIGIRFKVADPWSGSFVDMPQWLIDKYQLDMRPYFIDGGSGKLPDWDSSNFLDQHERVIQALGKRYNNDPRIAWVEIGSYGIWGEWHVHNNPHLAAKYCSKIKIFNAYISAFPDKKLVIPFDDQQILDYSISLGVGVRNDCLGDPKSNNWYTTNIKKVRSVNPVKLAEKEIFTGEFCGGEIGAQFALKKNYEENLSFIRKNKWSHLGPAGGSLLLSNKEKIMSFHKTLGYRFRLLNSDIRAPKLPYQPLKIKLNLENQGSTNFYYKWRSKLYIYNQIGEEVFSFYLPEKDWDIRKWKPGITKLKATIPLNYLNLKSGNYHIYIGIENPETKKAAIHFANKKRIKDFKYFIGSFNLKFLEVGGFE